MRITNQLLYSNFKRDYKRDSLLLNKLTSQISSGHKIQNSFDDSSIYIDSSRLEYEKTSLSQIKESSKSAQTFANNSDTVLNEFNDRLVQFKTKLIQAANASHDETSLNAIADDLQAIKENLMDLANTSIDGKFLFSGTAFAIKPIDGEGNYKGNANEVKATTGTDAALAYNIDGNSLFLGSDSDYKKMLSTNVKMYSNANDKKILKGSDTIKDMIENNGDNAGSIGSQTNAYFYIQAKNSDGSSFKKKLTANVNDTVDALLNSIKNSFSPNDSVNVVLNDYGQIEITDKNNGHKSLDFSIVGAVDKDGGADANVNDIDDLTSGSNVNIVSFVKSNFMQSVDASSEDVSFDRNYFVVDGNKLDSNVSQIDKNTNEFATANTKIVDTSGVSTLDGKRLYLRLSQIDGTTQNNVQIDFHNAGSTFSLDGGATNYNIYDADGNVTSADKMTYQQLNDVISMIISNNLPATNDKTGYDTAVSNAKGSVDVSLDYRGRLTIEDKLNSSTSMKFSMYDSSSDDFSLAAGNTVSFMSNNAITIDEPSIDMFKDIDKMINAVREGKFSADASSLTDKRNPGIENAIRRIDHIRDHVAKMHTKIGSLSNALDGAYQRSDMLHVQVTTLQSSIADADIGETLAKYNQISVSFQALLSTISKINKISLLNYL
jgi:flagellar hook-associated protein 3 FlgL